MTNTIPDKIRLDARGFIRDSLKFTSEQAFEKVRNKAGQVMFEGLMHDGITKKIHSPQFVSIRSATEQGMKFEEGFVGWAPFTDLLQAWAQKKGNQSVKDRVSKGKGISVNFARSPSYRFMETSQPTMGDIVKTTNKAFKINMKGGKIYG